ncbi:BURP domain [Dillenia turbinata]|uniref:BURP domain n=1 Tax=Dillenia turbinata TaxID=194707 RepID=A0AAN8VNT4_9MAGN
MQKPINLFCLLLLLCFLCSSNVVNGVSKKQEDSTENPFTPKAFLIRYWSKQITTNLPKSQFILSKASPLTAQDSAYFNKLAQQNSLSSHLDSFCSLAHLFCFPDLSPSLEKHDEDANFANYNNQNFTNYGGDKPGGVDSFKGYSLDENVSQDTFRRYSSDSTGHKEIFSAYGSNSNVPDQTFNTYGNGATGGGGEFTTYNDEVNAPNLRFTSYSAQGNGHKQSFTSYTDSANAGDESFTSYGKNGNGIPSVFTSYGRDTNVIGSGFSGYGEGANGANDSFTTYGFESNNGQNNFRSYGDGGNGGVETFSSYRDQANVGGDSFQSYGKNSNFAKVNFINYGKSFNEGTSKFTGYGKGSVEFKTYGPKDNTTFKDYAQKGITFSQYENTSSSSSVSTMPMSGKKINRWVEPGKFFREKMLKKGTVMPMPDIKDKMPRRSFLPRTILSKLPLSTSKIEELKSTFHAGENSTMESIISAALAECERAPSQGETKRCVGSAEDMIDFATSVLGRNIAVRTTESTNGSKQDIMIGSITGVDGGKVTQSVSCHQSLFPYLVYYCHSVPQVRVYEADLLDPKTKAKINHGVAICHLDTSAWSPTHGAFLALGSGPGKIEVCHWIFENDMTWTIAD